MRAAPQPVIFTMAPASERDSPRTASARKTCGPFDLPSLSISIHYRLSMTPYRRAACGIRGHTANVMRIGIATIQATVVTTTARLAYR